MNDLSKAAEMAWGVLLGPKTRADEVAEAVKVIRQALAPEVTPEVTPEVDNAKLDTSDRVLHKEWVGLTQDEVNSWELPDTPTVFEFAQFIEAKLKEKNT